MWLYKASDATYCHLYESVSLDSPIAGGSLTKLLTGFCFAAN